MATCLYTGLPSFRRGPQWMKTSGRVTTPGLHVSVCIGCPTNNGVTNPPLTEKPMDYRPSVPGPTYLVQFF